MIPAPNKPIRILAIHLTSRGFGFVVFESAANPVDWGVKAVRQDKTAKTLSRINDLIEHYTPSVMVLEDPEAKGSRRAKRIAELTSSIRALAAAKKVHSRIFARSRVQRVFAKFGGISKFEIAKTLATELPDLGARVPRYRKPWMNEDASMSIFDAASFAITYFFSLPVRNKALPGPAGAGALPAPSESQVPGTTAEEA